MDHASHLSWIRPFEDVLASTEAGQFVDDAIKEQLQECCAICDNILGLNADSPHVSSVRERIDNVLKTDITPVLAENEPKLWLQRVCVPIIQKAIKAQDLGPIIALGDSFEADQDRTDWGAAMAVLEQDPPNWQNTSTIGDIVNAINDHWCLPRHVLLMITNRLIIKDGTPLEFNRDNLWLSMIEAHQVITSYEIPSDCGTIPLHIINEDNRGPCCGYALHHGFITITEGFSERMTDVYDQASEYVYHSDSITPEQIQRKLFGQFLQSAYPDRDERRNANLNRVLLEEIIHAMMAEEIKKGVDFRSMTTRQFWCHVMKVMTPEGSQFYSDIQSRSDTPTPQEETDYNDANIARFELAARVAVAAKVEHPHYLVHEFGMLMHDTRSYPHYASARFGIMFAGQIFRFPQQMGMNSLSADDIQTLQIFKDALVSKCSPQQLRDMFRLQSDTLFTPILDKEPIRSWNSDSARPYLDVA